MPRPKREPDTSLSVADAIAIMQLCRASEKILAGMSKHDDGDRYGYMMAGSHSYEVRPSDVDGLRRALTNIADLTKNLRQIEERSALLIHKLGDQG